MAMQTPTALLDGAVTFIRPQFSFIWVTVLYNFSASVLRSFGNSRIPFYTLVLASILNIGLDLYLIAYLRWGIIGAAVATITAQAFSGVLNLIWLVAKMDFVDFRHPSLRYSSHHTGRLLYIALPMGFEYSVSALGAIIMQLAINSLGDHLCRFTNGRRKDSPDVYLTYGKCRYGDDYLYWTEFWGQKLKPYQTGNQIWFINPVNILHSVFNCDYAVCGFVVTISNWSPSRTDPPIIVVPAFNEFDLYYSRVINDLSLYAAGLRLFDAGHYCWFRRTNWPWDHQLDCHDLNEFCGNLLY